MLNRIKSSVIPLTIAATALIFASAVYAVDYPKASAPRASQASPTGILRACQARESAIKTRMTHLTKFAENMMNKFDKHVTRVEKYYTEKVVPSGKTVTKYDSLVSDINSKKVVVQAALTKAQNDVSGFNCAAGNPKGAMTQFRQDMQTVKKALKDFRTSTKNLIVAVHTVVSGEASESGKMMEKK